MDKRKNMLFNKALQHNYVDVANYLFKLDALITINYKFLKKCAKKNSVDSMEFIYNHFDVQQKWTNKLFIKSYKYSVEITKVLINCGANIRKYGKQLYDNAKSTTNAKLTNTNIDKTETSKESTSADENKKKIPINDDPCVINGKTDLKCIRHALKTIDCYNLPNATSSDIMSCLSTIRKYNSALQLYESYIASRNESDRIGGRCNALVNNDILLINNPYMIIDNTSDSRKKAMKLLRKNLFYEVSSYTDKDGTIRECSYETGCDYPFKCKEVAMLMKIIDKLIDDKFIG